MVYGDKHPSLYMRLGRGGDSHQDKRKRSRGITNKGVAAVLTKREGDRRACVEKIQKLLFPRGS